MLNFQDHSAPRRKRHRPQQGGNHRRRVRLEALEDRTLLTTINEFSLPSLPGGASSEPHWITAGPDGNLWFTVNIAGEIGRITPSGTVTEFPLPNSDCQPADITTGPDGNLWFTESAATPIGGGQFANHIGRITPNGVITEFTLPTVYSSPWGIAVGPDGNIWFTDLYGNEIGKITMSGQVTEYPIPTADSFPRGIVAGPDGNLWFTESQGNNIGRITTAGVITEFSIPDPQPAEITLGPDGNLWFTDASDAVDRITPTGVTTRFPISAFGTAAAGITTGPDGNLWLIEDFAGYDGSEIIGNQIVHYNLRLIYQLRHPFTQSRSHRHHPRPGR